VVRQVAASETLTMTVRPMIVPGVAAVFAHRMKRKQASLLRSRHTTPMIMTRSGQSGCMPNLECGGSEDTLCLSIEIRQPLPAGAFTARRWLREQFENARPSFKVVKKLT
jgi:hypothetical protein